MLLLSLLLSLLLFFLKEFLSLEDNPVTLLKGYRPYVVTRMPTLRVLDYVKITKSERAGGAMKIENGQLSGMSSGGSNGSSSSGSNGSGLSEEEKVALKVAVTQAKTKEELEVLVKALDEGKLPDGFTF
jgi:U2 small nuclear ribonucleoprotein A'